MSIRLRTATPYGRVSTPSTPLTEGYLYRECLAGREPAEMLRPSYREELVITLHGLGWTVVEIATHTQMSTYVTGAIHDRLGLVHNPESAKYRVAGA